MQPAELLLIGDSLNDTQAARAAGSPVFCVPYGYNRGRPVEELDLDAVVPSLAVYEEVLLDRVLAIEPVTAARSTFVLRTALTRGPFPLEHLRGAAR